MSTNWTNIPDANIDAGSPMRDVDLMAMRDNPIAIAERASGAPWQNIGDVTTLTSSGTWTVPTGVYRIIVTCIGGGQGGGLAQTDGNGNGLWNSGQNGGNTIFASVVAAGGSGGAMSGLVSNNGGRGLGLHGMGGKIVRQSITVTPAQAISYTIGTGGAGYSGFGVSGGNGLIIVEW